MTIVNQSYQSSIKLLVKTLSLTFKLYCSFVLQSSLLKLTISVSVRSRAVSCVLHCYRILDLSLQGLLLPLMLGDRYTNACTSVISKVVNLLRHIGAEVRAASCGTLFIVAINFTS